MIHHSSLMIKKYQALDRSPLLEVLQANIPKYFAPEEFQDFEKYLAKYANEYFTVHQDGIVVGGVGCKYDACKKQGIIAWIFFHPDFAGKGLGKLAVNHCLEQLKLNEDIQSVKVRTSQFANLFFEKFGFETILYEKDYWAPGFDLYHMEKEIEN